MLSDRLRELAKAVEEKALAADEYQDVVSSYDLAPGVDFRDIKDDLLSLAEEAKAEEYAAAIVSASTRQALEFYADPKSWDFPAQHYEDAETYSDQGAAARKALGRA